VATIVDRLLQPRSTASVRAISVIRLLPRAVRVHGLVSVDAPAVFPSLGTGADQVLFRTAIGLGEAGGGDEGTLTMAGSTRPLITPKDARSSLQTLS
jgi:hypothetical protein